MKEINIDKFKFIYAYINYLVQNDNYILDKFNIEKHYYSILNSIKENNKNNHISFNNDLTEELGQFTMCGYLRPMKIDNNSFHILKYKKNYDIDEFIDEMIKKLIEIDILADKYDDLEVMICNPNGKYNILIGNVGDKKISWDIFTDGEVYKDKIQIIKGSNITINPEDKSQIKLDNLSKEIVNVYESSYVIKQGLINDMAIANTLYISMDNSEKIDEIAKQYCKKKI